MRLPKKWKGKVPLWWAKLDDSMRLHLLDEVAPDKGFPTLRMFKCTAAEQKEWRDNPAHSEPCWMCKDIARRLGLPV